MTKKISLALLAMLLMAGIGHAQSAPCPLENSKMEDVCLYALTALDSTTTSVTFNLPAQTSMFSHSVTYSPRGSMSGVTVTISTDAGAGLTTYSTSTTTTMTTQTLTGAYVRIRVTISGATTSTGPIDVYYSGNSAVAQRMKPSSTYAGAANQIAFFTDAYTVGGNPNTTINPVTGALSVEDGTVSAPAYTFGSQNSMGFWKIGTNQLGFLGSGLTIHSTTNTGAGANIRGLQLTSDPGSPRSDVTASDGSGAYDRLVVSGNPIQFATFETAFSVNSSGRVASATDYFDAVGGKSGIDPAMYGFGSSTNINLRFRPKGSGYLAVGSADNTGNIGALTDRLTGLYTTSIHSGASAFTFSTSSGDMTALTLQTNGNALFGVTSSVSIGTSNTSGFLNLGGNFYWSGYPSVSSSLSGAICMSASNLIEVNTNVSGCLVSALKYKTNITDISPSDSLDLVLNMHPVTYDLKEDETNHQFGFIADWAEKVHPGLATYDKNGEISGFRYEQYTAYLTGAVQQLNTRIENLEKTGKSVVQ